jgi:RecG-like helicase
MSYTFFQNEFNTWGHFNVAAYSGPAREKALLRIKDGLDFILIAGKSLFVRAGDFEQLATVEWKLVIVDEFHEFKNCKSQGHMRLVSIRDNSGCPVVGMT